MLLGFVALQFLPAAHVDTIVVSLRIKSLIEYLSACLHTGVRVFIPEARKSGSGALSPRI